MDKDAALERRARMKRSAFDHPKIGRLAKLLDVPKYGAIGIVESLWQFTAKHAPAGDVGKWSDEEIAASMGWTGDSSALVSALVEARLLDLDPAARLIVHDWNEHCEDSIHLILARRVEFFANGIRPSLARINKTDRPQLEAAYVVKDRDRRRTAGARNTHGTRIKARAMPEPEPEPCLSLSHARPEPCQAAPESEPDSFANAKPCRAGLDGSGDVGAVVEHYRAYHPTARPGDRERAKIRARFKEGYTVDDLKTAIDGCHRSPYHCGENERGRIYQTLELIVRDSSKVAQFIELAKDDRPLLSEKNSRTASVLAKRREQREAENGER